MKNQMVLFLLLPNWFREATLLPDFLKINIIMCRCGGIVFGHGCRLLWLCLLLCSLLSVHLFLHLRELATDLFGGLVNRDDKPNNEPDEYEEQ